MVVEQQNLEPERMDIEKPFNWKNQLHMHETETSLVTTKKEELSILFSYKTMNERATTIIETRSLSLSRSSTAVRFWYTLLASCKKKLLSLYIGKLWIINKVCYANGLKTG